MSFIPVRLWQRVQETPLEIAIAALAVGAAVLMLSTRGAVLTGWKIAAIVALAVGGTVLIIGRFTDKLTTESAGLALLIGGFLFLTLDELPRARNAVETASILLNLGALVIGYSIRLYVVRKALQARMLVARKQRL